MKKEEINLNNIKIAIFDFDDILAIHEDNDYIKLIMKLKIIS